LRFRGISRLCGDDSGFETASSRQKTRPLVITIDGPAGVGKSTVAKLLSAALDVTYLDTGATYRSLAYAVLREGLNPVTDVGRITRLARRLPLELHTVAGGSLRVLLDGADITQQIRTEEVSEAAAQISQHPQVRAAMVELQRSLANRRGVVVEGRDTGSVVFPHAAHKFFLDAASDVRVRRRQHELERLYGCRPPLAQIREQLHFRDGLDRSRRVGPLVKPKGAIAIDTTHQTAQQVVEVMRKHIRKAGYS
jgi:cytidylate kinase